MTKIKINVIIVFSNLEVHVINVQILDALHAAMGFLILE
jgi:hypothetical protein